MFLYENTTVLPRAYLVGNFEVSANDLDALTRMRTGAFDPHTTVLLNEAPALKPENDESAQATLQKYSRHDIVVETQSASPQILVVSDNYYPIGWQAYVDEAPVKTLRANHAFRAVEVPAGKHRVAMRYASGAYTAGAFTSLGALTLIVGLIALGLRASKNDLQN